MFNTQIIDENDMLGYKKKKPTKKGRSGKGNENRTNIFEFFLLETAKLENERQNERGPHMSIHG